MARRGPPGHRRCTRPRRHPRLAPIRSGREGIEIKYSTYVDLTNQVCAPVSAFNLEVVHLRTSVQALVLVTLLPGRRSRRLRRPQSSAPPSQCGTVMLVSWPQRRRKLPDSWQRRAKTSTRNLWTHCVLALPRIQGTARQGRSLWTPH